MLAFLENGVTRVNREEKGKKGKVEGETLESGGVCGLGGRKRSLGFREENCAGDGDIIRFVCVRMEGSSSPSFSRGFLSRSLFRN